MQILLYKIMYLNTYSAKYKKRKDEVVDLDMFLHPHIAYIFTYFLFNFSRIFQRKFMSF